MNNIFRTEIIIKAVELYLDANPQDDTPYSPESLIYDQFFSWLNTMENLKVTPTYVSVDEHDLEYLSEYIQEV